MANLPIAHNVVGAFDDRFRTVIDAKIRAAAAALNLTIPIDNGGDLADYTYLGVDSTRFRNRPMAASTRENYEGKFRQLWKYLAIKGDYESMLMLLVVPPQHCPSMNAHSLEEFFKFKRQAPGSPLNDVYGNQVYDIMGNPIMCDGRWNTPFMASYKAGISDLHAMDKPVTMGSHVKIVWPFQVKPNIMGVNIIVDSVGFVAVVTLWRVLFSTIQTANK